MSWPAKVIRICFHLLLVLVPLIFLPNNSELFEFNKIVATYSLTSVIVFAWVSDMIFQRKIIFRRSLLDWPILLFLASQLLSFFFSINQQISLLGYYSRFNGGLLSLVSYSLLYWSFVTYMDRKSTLTNLKFALLAAFLVSLYGAAQHMGIDAHIWVQDVQNRVFSTLGQPNWLASYLIALVFIPLSWLTSKKGGYFHLFLFALLFVCLIYTKSRSGMLAFGLSWLVFWGLTIKQSGIKTVKNYLAVIAWLSVIVFPLLISNPFRDYLFPPTNTSPPVKTPTGTVLESGGTNSEAIRKIVWTGAVRAWLSSNQTILIGTGPETFTMAYYQNRPPEHNATSEWELLYNKAHNEFLNYLTTTGILGLGSYLVLLVVMGYVLIRSVLIPPPAPLASKSDHAKKIDPTYSNLSLALLAGWLTIPFTNFWGFSVVPVQILMFLLPAISLSFQRDPPVPLPPSENSFRNVFLFLIALCAAGYVQLMLARYWLADTKYSGGQTDLRAFALTQEVSYIVSAYQKLNQAYELNSSEPAISSELALATAYMSVLTSDSDASTSAGLKKITEFLINKSISANPHHPNYYKSASKAAIILSTVNPEMLDSAAKYLLTASEISPTDPRIPYNLGVIYKYQEQFPKAKAEFENSLKLKPDFADPKLQLEEIASQSAKIDSWPE
ncbi:hypothetical protein A2397_02115 [Candidatus Amesbacteria bacterium RIFOXYB1_FULL_44_23]|uniref:O-antigen ligase-related domain-containing protein n=1 Tax=Candidatus Amesbacteria bacterium RIFOXYB1_FULL_44_23 TaxID=1797263 RepID=A0A1F4ZT80_9BACT|nr:MAG: hypothetical protein A2397_02115 [Candidatus Amesbacteria bacterium RIFOXYB1_FULL_44_23]